MSEAEAVVTRGRRPAAIWLLPVVAAVLGIWMVIYNYLSEGPTVTIEFATAKGLEAGKTRIRALEVDVGVVEEVRLKDDLSGVVVKAKIEKSAEHLLREDTEFWVVYARVGAGGVSGLGTILSGGYMQLSPGTGAPGRREFVGLEDVPVTPVGTPGLKVTLVSDTAGSLSVGNPVVYRGYTVGKVEHTHFDADTQKVYHDIFIRAPYDTLVSTATRFFNVSGLSINTTPDGVEIDMASLEALLAGGVSFDLPEGVPPGGPVEPGGRFRLYPNRESVSEDPYAHGLEMVVAFRSSVRGLVAGAPVEYRGIRIGTVKRIMIKELVEEGLRGAPIPVLIRIEPGRYELADSAEGVAALQAELSSAVDAGFRASLETGSLITGRLFVGLDYYPDSPAASVGEFRGYPKIPTIESGLDQLTRKVGTFLDSLNDMPLAETVASANATVTQLESTLATLQDVLAEVKTLVGSDSVKNLPEGLEETLAQLTATLNAYSDSGPLYSGLQQTLTELETTLSSIRRLARTLEEKPNAIIFSGSPAADPEPEAP